MPLWLIAAVASVLMTVGRFIPTWVYIAFISISAGLVIAMFSAARRPAY